MAKVASSSAFPREIYKTGVTGYTEEYLVAKARVGEHFLERPHRRKLCYFLDGDKSGEPLICLHGGGEGKYNFLQKQPIPGVLMISVDRMGYGASDLFEPVNVYTFAHVAEDIAALADHLGLDQFVVCGFSIGSSWGMSLALALPGRVRGLALFGAMADTGHPKMTKATIKEVGKPPAVLDPVTGSCGCILRGAFAGGVKSNKKFDFSEAFSRESTLPKCAKRWAAFKDDPFWVCSKVDSFLAFNRPEALLGDAYRSLCNPWPFDICNIKCPVNIFQGEGDYDMGSSNPASPNFLKLCMPHAEYEKVEGCGHVLVTGPTELFQSQVLKAIQRMPKL